MNRTYLLRAAHDSYKVVNLNECRDGVDYLCEGGILNILLLESLNPKDKISLFYTLSYIWMLYGAKYPKGTPEMEDDDYTLYSKVVGELKQIVPDMMEMLKNTYEAWLFEHVGFYGLRTLKDDIFNVGSGTYILVEKKNKYLPNRKHLLGEYSFRESLIGNFGEEDKGVLTAIEKRDTSRKLNVYRVGKKRRIPAQPMAWFSTWNPEDPSLLGAIEEFYGGPVTIKAILSLTYPVTALIEIVEWDWPAVETLVKAYNRYMILTHDWKHLVGNVSVLLNEVHVNGNMADYLGSKIELKYFGISMATLKKMSNLHRYVPEGNDHKTLRFIYNNWRRLV